MNIVIITGKLYRTIIRRDIVLLTVASDEDTLLHCKARGTKLVCLLRKMASRGELIERRVELIGRLKTRKSKHNGFHNVVIVKRILFKEALNFDNSVRYVEQIIEEEGVMFD